MYKSNPTILFSNKSDREQYLRQHISNYRTHGHMLVFCRAGNSVGFLREPHIIVHFSTESMESVMEDIEVLRKDDLDTWYGYIVGEIKPVGFSQKPPQSIML